MTHDDRMETITDPAEIRATDEPDERNTTIVGMVDDLGRPATIYTPPEVLRRDPARWPTPAEFVSEWEQHSPERRLYLAERILSDAQKVERLDEAIDLARWERAQAEDAETEATARAESAEAEVRRLTEEAREARALTSIHSLAMLKAQERAEAAEAAVVTLRAKVAAVEALVNNGQTVGWIERDGDVAWIAADAIRAALAVTTGEGQ